MTVSVRLELDLNPNIIIDYDYCVNERKPKATPPGRVVNAHVGGPSVIGFL